MDLASSTVKFFYTDSYIPSLDTNRVLPKNMSAETAFEIGSKKKYNYLAPTFIRIIEEMNLGFRIAEFIFDDVSGIREMLSLTGNEIFSIEFQNNTTLNTSLPKKIDFEVYSMSEMPNANASTVKSRRTILQVIAVEYPLFTDIYGKKIKKSYKNKKISDIINDILSKEMSVSSKNNYKIEVENTRKVLPNFYIPSWTARKTIDYLRDYADGIDSNSKFSFFITDDIAAGSRTTLNFKSIGSLMKQKPAYEFLYLLEHSDGLISSKEPGNASTTTLNKVIDYNLININKSDYLTGDLRGRRAHTYNYSDNQYLEISRDYDMNISGIDKNSDSFIQPYVSGISNDLSNSVIERSIIEDDAGYFVDNEMLVNSFQSLFNQKCIRIKTFGWEQRNIGQNVFCSFPSRNIDGIKPEVWDKMIIGEWIITRIEHVFDGTRKYYSYIDLNKIGFFDLADRRNNTNF